MKNIDTLVEALDSVIYGQGGWRKSIAEAMGKNIADVANKRFSSSTNDCKWRLWKN